MIVEFKLLYFLTERANERMFLQKRAEVKKKEAERKAFLLLQKAEVQCDPQNTSKNEAKETKKKKTTKKKRVKSASSVRSG
jgi:hypothetical protein